jgi:branched-subunit amino acid ABC-type transport system permease component
VVNVAQGMLVILSAYLSYTVHQKLGIDPFATIVIVMPVMFAATRPSTARSPRATRTLP